MKKRIPFIICILLAFVLNVCGVKAEGRESTIPEEAYTYTIDKEYSLEVTVQYGYEAHVKYGRYMPIYIEIFNTGKDFSGSLQAIVPKSSDNTMYKKEVHLKSKDSIKETFLLPLTDDTGLLQVQLLDQKDHILLEERYSLSIGNYTRETYIGVISDSYEELEYLDSIDTKVFRLDNSSLTADYRELDLLDIIVVNQFDTSRINEGQRKAIKEWIVNGGTLVLGTVIPSEPLIYKNIKIKTTNEEIRQIKEKLNKHLDNQKLIQLNIEGRNDFLKTKGISPILYKNQGIEQEIRELVEQLKEEEISKAVTDKKLEGFSTVLEYDAIPIIQKKELGKGVILAFSYDLSLEKEQITTGRSILSSLLDNQSYYKKRQLEMEYYGNGSVYDVVSRVAHEYMENTPNVLRYTGVIILYLLAIGLSYIILKRLDKKTLTWVTIPCIAVFFTLLIFFIGRDTRISSPYISYLEFLTFDDSYMVTDEIYFSLTSPYNEPYSTEVDKKYKVTELKDAAYSYEMNHLHPKYTRNIFQYNAKLIEGGESFSIHIKGNPAFSSTYYQGKDIYKEDKHIKADIQYYGKELEGKVTNEFDFDIQNGMLVSDGYIIDLGTIESGGEVTLTAREEYFYMSPYELYDNEFLIRALDGDSSKKNQTGTVKKKLNVLEYLLQNSGLPEEQSYIIGYKTEDSSFVEMLKRQVNVYGLQVVILPIDVNYTKDNITLVPSLDPYLKEEMELSYNSPRYLYEEDKEVEYILPKGEHILSFEWIEERNKESTSEYLTSFKGNIYFYNYRLEEYEKVFDASKVVEAANYVSEDGRLKVKYELDISIRGSWVITPYISYWKEETSASNQ